MKKLFFTLTAALCFTASVQAQEIERVDTRVTVNRIRFGAYIAPNLSWMRPTATKSDNGAYEVSNNGSKVGFTYGLMAEYYFARNYAIVTGLQVNSTGGKINAVRVPSVYPGGYVVNRANFDYRLQYLEIPIALKLRTDDINGFKFFGQLGLTVGFNIGKKATYDVSYVAPSDTSNLATASGDKVKLTGGLGSIAPIMLAMNIGAGAEYPINKKLTAYAGIFFNNGFAPDATDPGKYDVEKLGYYSTFQDGKTRLNNFALRVGLFF
jgi:hypothetical protein